VRQIALIQKVPTKVDSPQNINNYDKTIYDVQKKHLSTNSRFKKSPKSIQCFAFGDIHYIDKQEDFNPQELEKYLKQHSHQDIVIKISKQRLKMYSWI
jgi:hypothetical protein